MPEEKICRPMTRINRDRQEDFFSDVATSPSPAPTRSSRFIDPDPNEITVGRASLASHLESMGIRDAFVVRAVLRELDYAAFESRYPGGGRPAYAPVSMVGLVLYGLLRGVSSLRELERFARTDLGCMWVSGGNTPDHSVLGRFLHRHETELSEVLFGQVVETVLRRTQSSRDRLAGDGTVIEAMSSRYGILTREAAEQRLGVLDAQPTLAASEAEEQLRLSEMVKVLGERRSRAGGRGHDRLNPAEPDAAVLKQKGSSSARGSYVPVVLANEARVVVDAEVDSSQEIRPMEAMLERQAETLDEVSLDAGFRARSLLERSIELDVSVLAPSEGGERGVKRRSGYFGADRFRYDEQQDIYICPAGEVLKRRAKYRRHRRAQYTSHACMSCPLHDQCTKGKRRVIERTRATELREGLKAVMSQPQAKLRYTQRKAMVEPVFSSLRGRQGLNRFRRRGLSGARLEFRLHIMAYNLGRALAWSLSSLIRRLWRPLGDLQANVAFQLDDLVGEANSSSPQHATS